MLGGDRVKHRVGERALVVCAVGYSINFRANAA
jgi:hypothetical protein